LKNHEEESKEIEKFSAKIVENENVPERKKTSEDTVEIFKRTSMKIKTIYMKPKNLI